MSPAALALALKPVDGIKRTVCDSILRVVPSDHIRSDSVHRQTAAAVSVWSTDHSAAASHPTAPCDLRLDGTAWCSGFPYRVGDAAVDRFCRRALSGDRTQHEPARAAGMLHVTRRMLRSSTHVAYASHVECFTACCIRVACCMLHRMSHASPHVAYASHAACFTACCMLQRMLHARHMLHVSCACCMRRWMRRAS